LKNDKKDKKDDKKVDIKKSGSKDTGGGFFSCCGPRQAEAIESDEDEHQHLDSEEDEELMQKKDDPENEEPVGFFAEECYSAKQKLAMGHLDGNTAGDDP